MIEVDLRISWQHRLQQESYDGRDWKNIISRGTPLEEWDQNREENRVPRIQGAA
jgi:hypothetical protein